MIARINRAITEKDKGFTLIELLVVIIIIGILSAVAIPLFLNQQKKAGDATVKSDLKNYATGAETFFTDALTYPTTPAGFASNGATTPIKSDKNTYAAFVDVSGPDAGYVIYGLNEISGAVWELSSYTGGKQKKTALTTLPTALPTVTEVGAPTGTTFVAVTPTW